VTADIIERSRLGSFLWFIHLSLSSSTSKRKCSGLVIDWHIREGCDLLHTSLEYLNSYPNQVTMLVKST